MSNPETNDPAILSRNPERIVNVEKVGEGARITKIDY